jgi:hypothetical protein
MEFIITARDFFGIVGWVGLLGPDGPECLGSRAEALLFATAAEAQRVIDSLPELFSRSSIFFSVEPARVHAVHHEVGLWHSGAGSF